MKIQNYYQQYQINKKDKLQNNRQNVSNQDDTACQKEVRTYSPVYFTAKLNPLKYTPNTYGLKSKKEFMIKQFDDILQNDVTEKEMTEEEVKLKALNRAVSFIFWKKRRLDALESEMVLLVERAKAKGPGYSAQWIWQEKNAIVKEYKKIEQLTTYPAKKENKPVQKKVASGDSTLDFGLINKFKSAVADDNFDLKRVFREHYEPLNNMTSIKELKQKYPQIDIPKNPKDVVAQKIESTFTREFYETLDDFYESGDKEKAKEYALAGVNAVLESQLKKSSPAMQKEIQRKVIPSTLSCINKRLKSLRENDGFSSYPMVRKIKQPIISDIDKKMLSLDYNDFVLSVVRDQYLNMSNPNDFVYSYNKGKPGQRTAHQFKVSELKATDYRFGKIPVKIRGILNDAEEMKFVQRNYDYFSNEELRNRLEFQADRMELNERVLDSLVKFESCRFEPEDIDMMKCFLREGDNVIDGRKSMKEFVDYIDRNSISPRGTERLDELERQERIAQIKQEQKHLASVQHLQSKFDDNVNLLYQNNMSYSAEMCAAYRPKDCTDEEKKITKALVGIVSKYVDADKGNVIQNKDRLALELTRWDKYQRYKKADEKSDLLPKAEAFAKDKDGNIDYEKAGMYLLNAEAVESYPQSFEYARNKKAAEKIMKHFGNDKTKSTEYLCKYDNYLDMTTEEKSHISNVLKIFDKNDNFDSDLLEDIVVNEYVNLPTSAWAMMTENGSKKVKATLAPEAKKSICEYYGSTDCVDFFEKFEFALTKFAPKRGGYGIKKIDKDLYELKIKGYDDRVLAHNDAYYFDDFDEVGLHQKNKK